MSDHEGDHADAGAEHAPEEEVAIENNPIVPEVEVKTHEEEEEVVFKIRSKLFRFDKDMQQWKERGTGDVKLLRHKETKKMRLLMRQEKTLKVIANHYINPLLVLRENAGSDRSWVWTTHDFADGAVKDEIFAIRFGNSDHAQQFKKEFEAAKAEMGKLLNVVPATPEKKADSAAPSPAAAPTAAAGADAAATEAPKKDSE